MNPKTSKNQFKVYLVDSGQIKEASNSDLTHILVATKIPSLIGKFCFTNMAEKKWTEREITKLRDLILNKEVTVNVTKKREDVVECFISSVLQSDGSVIDNLNNFCFDEKVNSSNISKLEMPTNVLMSINEIERINKSLIVKGIHEIVDSVTENLHNESSEEEYEEKEEDNFEKIKRQRRFQIIIEPKINNFELITSNYQIREFLFSSANYFDNRLILKPHIEQLNGSIDLMKKIIDKESKNFKLIRDIEQLRRQPKYPRCQFAKYCLVKRNGEYFRGKVLKVAENEDKVTVLLVDVPEIIQEKCSNENLYEMVRKLLKVPCANISVKLKPEGRSSENKEKRIKKLLRVLNTSEQFKNGEKMFKAKVYEFIKYGESIVEIYDSDINKKLS